MKTIKYIAYYNTNDNLEERVVFPSASSKINTISNSIGEMGLKVDILSFSNTTSCKQNSPKTVKQISNNVRLVLQKGYRRGGKIRNKISGLLFKMSFWLYCFKNIKKGDTVIAYHSTNYIEFLKWIKRLKKIKLILEVEEIYGDVSNAQKMRQKEYSLFPFADAYIFPTIMLNDKVNTNNKPYVVINGTYDLAKEMSVQRPNEQIKCVYAGTLDEIKGGALNAVLCAQYLDERYKICIIGRGSEEEKNSLNKQIAKVNELSDCNVVYDGEKSGDEFLEYLQSCHIGLSTQNTEKEYNNTSFPSKILTYFSNGLRVVAGRCENFETSHIGDMLYYYDGNDPKSIANAIKSINFNDEYFPRERLVNLKNRFNNDIYNLINSLGKTNANKLRS